MGWPPSRTAEFLPRGPLEAAPQLSRGRLRLPSASAGPVETLTWGSTGGQAAPQGPTAQPLPTGGAVTAQDNHPAPLSLGSPLCPPRKDNQAVAEWALLTGCLGPEAGAWWTGGDHKVAAAGQLLLGFCSGAAETLMGRAMPRALGGAECSWPPVPGAALLRGPQGHSQEPPCLASQVSREPGRQTGRRSFPLPVQGQRAPWKCCHTAMFTADRRGPIATAPTLQARPGPAAQHLELLPLTHNDSEPSEKPGGRGRVMAAMVTLWN